MEVRADVHLEASPERVFDVLMDPDCLEHWVTAHREITEPADGPLDVGSTFKQKLRVAGVSFAVTWEVTKLERPKLAEWKGKGPGGSRAKATYRLKATGGGTEFHYVNEWKLPGGKLAAIAGKAIGEDRARDEAERSLENLKRHLAKESG